MLLTIILFGALALPFAALTHRSYAVLRATSVPFCLLTTIQGAYGTMEASYIPLFMRASGWYQQRPRIKDGRAVEAVEAVEALYTETQTSSTGTSTAKKAFNKGVRVSVLGLFVSNVGSLTALLIGLIITNTRGQPAMTGYQK